MFGLQSQERKIHFGPWQVQNLLPLVRLSVVMCLILTCFWLSGRPVSATSTPRVKFTNRRKEEPLPAPNVVTRPRRPKTSACPVSCTHGSEPLFSREIVGGSDYLPKYFLYQNGIVNRPFYIKSSLPPSVVKRQLELAFCICPFVIQG